MTRVVAEQAVGGVMNAANAAMPMVKSTLRLKSGKVKRRNQGRCSIKGCTKHSVYVCSHQCRTEAVLVLQPYDGGGE